VTARPGAASSAALSAAGIAAAVQGVLEGDGGVVVNRVAVLENADAAAVAFFSASRYAEDAATTKAGVVLVTPELAARVSHVPARILVQSPQDAMLTTIALLHRPVRVVPVGVHPSAVVGDGVTLGADAGVGAGAVIGDGAQIGAGTQIGMGAIVGAGVEIGRDCLIHANVTLYAGTVLADRIILHSGVVLGSDGFGYVFGKGQHQKIPHVGRCLIASDVEIGANSTVDRGSVGDTMIGAGTKIDNLVHLGHNVHVGPLCLLMAQVGVSGSARIGSGVIIAGQAGLAGHIQIGDGARIAGQAGVFGDVPAGETWSGYPARPHRESLRAQAAVHQLPALLKGLRPKRGAPE
jgi:UDP-3-O-[3-hydroxymyristoyl] glucosamine N-acyltransferase